ncbi:MAG: formyltransferase family protein, partial [Bacteroidales bacterium]
MKNVAIFASGSGSNAQAIVEYFRKQGKEPVKLILTNNPKAYVLERTRRLGIESVIFSYDDLYHSTKVLEILRERQIDFIVLAGFLWLIPPYLLEAYRGRIVNIHPALLPKYGGKGMYGMK